MTDTIQADDDVHASLAIRKQIAVIWCIEDVKEVRPDLSDDQCWDVLQNLNRSHDATIGINWDVIDCVADILFPDASAEDDV